MCRNADLVLQRSATTKAARTRWGCLCRPGTYAIVDVHQERLERAPAGGAGAGSSWSQALARTVGQASVCRRLGSGAGRLGVARSHSIVYSLFESACYQKPDEWGRSPAPEIAARRVTHLSHLLPPRSRGKRYLAANLGWSIEQPCNELGGFGVVYK